MRLSPGDRKLSLTLHVLASVGWLGAVTAFLALAIVGLDSSEVSTVRGAYVGMGLVASYVIVPLAIASFATGLIESLGSAWGLFRHYWVIAKLFITLLSTAILLVHMQPIGFLARAAAAATLGPGDYREVRLQMLVDAAAAIVALVVATVFAIYKPRGVTAYGWRKQREELRERAEPA